MAIEPRPMVEVSTTERVLRLVCVGGPVTAVRYNVLGGGVNLLNAYLDSTGRSVLKLPLAT